MTKANRLILLQLGLLESLVPKVSCRLGGFAPPEGTPKKTLSVLKRVFFLMFTFPKMSDLDCSDLPLSNTYSPTEEGHVCTLKVVVQTWQAGFGLSQIQKVTAV